jgi:hypothetical protein
VNGLLAVMDVVRSPVESVQLTVVRVVRAESCEERRGESEEGSIIIHENGLNGIETRKLLERMQ